MLSSSSTITDVADVFAVNAVLSSPIRTYEFPTISATITTLAGIDSGDEDVTISNIDLRDAVYYAASDHTRAIVTGVAGTGCRFELPAFDWKASASLYAVTKEFSSKSISPTSVVQRGPNSNTYPITVSFTTSAKIPGDG